MGFKHMIIDSHEHVMLPTDIQIEKMQEAGVDKVVLFSTAPHPERAATLQGLKDEMSVLYKVLSGENTKEESQKRMRKSINELVEIVKAYPDQFVGFGSVPFGLSLEETVAWVEKYIVFNNLKGIGEFTPGSKEQISQLEVVFQSLKKYPQFPVWIHTFDPVTKAGIDKLMELTEKYPYVSVIFGHMGGYHWMDVVEFAKSHSNVYIDLSAAFSTLAARIAVAELPKRCLFSSDAPYGEPKLSRQLIEFVSPSEEITRLVLGENIRKLLKL